MNIIHLGAKDCVTGSCHLVQTNQTEADNVNILVDCGTAYGNDPELPFDQFPVKPEDVDYLFFTHAHIDHIGRLPELLEAGFQGEIICTHATKALLIPMLHDSMSFSNEPTKTSTALRQLLMNCHGGLSFTKHFLWEEPRNYCTNWIE